MNNQDEKWDDVISKLEHIRYELQLQPVETKPEIRVKELQHELNIIKQFLDDYKKNLPKQLKVLKTIRDRKGK